MFRRSPELTMSHTTDHRNRPDMNFSTSVVFLFVHSTTLKIIIFIASIIKKTPNRWTSIPKRAVPTSCLWYIYFKIIWEHISVASKVTGHLSHTVFCQCYQATQLSLESWYLRLVSIVQRILIRVQKRNELWDMLHIFTSNEAHLGALQQLQVSAHNIHVLSPWSTCKQDMRRCSPDVLMQSFGKGVEGAETEYKRVWLLTLVRPGVEGLP